MFDFIKQNLQKYSELFSCQSHAILLESTDTELCLALAKMYAMNNCCLSENKPCLLCSNCLKILDNNSIDTLIFPKSDNLTVDEVKEIIDNLTLIPVENEYKIYIITNFEDVNPLLQNKLLKSIEEPPRYVKFILTTKNKLKVIPTIVSRCECILVPKFTDIELEDFLSSLPSEKRQIISENSNGDITLATQIVKDESFIENYNFALNILLNLKSSKDMLKYSSVLVKNKKNLIDIHKILDSFYSDIIKILSKEESLVKNQFCLKQLKIISCDYNIQAILEIKKVIFYSYDKLDFNGNINSIVDSLLITILEEKWKSKK